LFSGRLQFQDDRAGSLHIPDRITWQHHIQEETAKAVESVSSARTEVRRHPRAKAQLR
jgi:hypothetical protein